MKTVEGKCNSKDSSSKKSNPAKPTNKSRVYTDNTYEKHEMIE